MLPTLLKWICSLLLLVSALLAQGTPANLAQQLSFVGLRSAGGKGQFLSVATDASQSIFLLYDQGDGVRLLKVSPDATKQLPAATLGQAGDVGSAMVLDSAGNVYITGISSSGKLHATAGAAFSDPAAGTSGSFVARFDANLIPAWVSFTGGSRISASAIAANSNAVFITGITYGNDLPVSDSAILQQPAYGSVQNGFVEKFSADGSSLLYATYISGASGDTTPTGIAVDAEDDAWLVGSTTAPGFPTLSALVPEALSNPSGFLMELTPAADGITFSTFVPGNGLTSIALDAASQTLVASGNVALGQFPLDTVACPLIPAAYQSVLRFALDGSAVLNGAVIAPGTRSAVTVASGGSAWIAGDFDPSFAPLLPQSAIAGIGSSFAVRTNATGTIDQTVRFGGLPIEDQTFAGIPASIRALAVQGDGSLLAAGAVQPTASSSLLGVERYDLPLDDAGSAILGSTVTAAEPVPASCGGSLCSGSAALLEIVQTATSAAGPVLSLDELPFGTLRNLGSSDIDGLRITSSAGSIATNCLSTLAAGAECSLLFTGGGAGVLTVSSTNAAQLIIPFPSYQAPAGGAVVFSPREADFGIVAAASGPVARTFTLSNLGTATEIVADGPANSLLIQSPYFEQQSDCALAGSGDAKVLGPGSVCHITIGLTASDDSANDGSQRAAWSFGSRQALLTGYTQAASLGLSASEIDFGVDLEGGLTPPRYLYLSNSSNQPLGHAPVSLPGDSPFQVTDTCPSILGASSVCRIRLDYASAKAPSTDSASLQLDQGLSVVLTGTTKPQPADGGSSANPNLALAPSAVSFATSVPVTGVSTETQTVAISNSGGLPFSVSLAVVGDFTYTTSCSGNLGPGESCAVALAFAPSQPGPRQGLLLVSASAGAGSISVPLSGIAMPIFSANNGLLDFGSIPVSQPTFQFLKVLSPFSLLTVAVSPPFRVALVEDNGSGPGALPDTAYVAGGTGTCRNCWIALLFDPSTPGPQSGSLTITSTATGSPYLLSLSGFGIASAGMVLSPAVAGFGSVPILSESGTQRLNVSNLTSPGVPVSLSPPGVTGDFAIDSTDQSANSCGGTLGPGASCILSVRFLPSATGSREGTLTLPTSAGEVTGTLNGNGAFQNSLSIKPLALDFESDQGASAAVKQVQITNTGAIAAAVGPPSTTSSNFAAAASCGELDPGASCTVAVTFTASAQLAQDTLSIPVTNIGSDHQAVTAQYAVALSASYTAASAGLTLFPSTFGFGSQATQTLSAARVVNVNNVSSRTLTLALEAPRNFTVAGTTCTTLLPGASCSIDLAFLPMTNGASSGSLAVTTTDQAGSPGPAGIVYAQGFGVGTGSLNISGGLIVGGTYSFGSIAPGQLVTNTFTVANLSSATLPIWVRRVTSRPPFLSSTNCSAPLNLGETCSIQVTYAPVSGGSSGPDTGLLSIESDAQTGPDMIALTGQAASTLSAANATSLASYTISQGSLSFPSVEVGDTSSAQVVTLTNTGNLELNFTSVSASADFLIESGCQLLPPGSQCNVLVMSSPHLPGDPLRRSRDRLERLIFVGFCESRFNGWPCSAYAHSHVPRLWYGAGRLVSDPSGAGNE